jgi:phospholipid/cholesterol/gamma-HCH transport system substrate-binding protein
MNRERAIEIRAGFFVVLLFAVFAVTMFFLGREKNLFKQQATLTARFASIAGLKPSAPVRLAGVDIGTVNEIELPERQDEKRIKVTLRINSEVLGRIRADSLAAIDSQGLLGDKLVNISLGSMDQKALRHGDEIKTADPTDFNEALLTGREVLENMRTISRDLKSAVATYSTPEFQADVKTIVRSIADVTRGVVEGPGLAHEIIYNPQMAAEGRAVSTNAVEVSRRLARSVEQAETLLSQLEHGQGTLHGLLYERDGKRILDNIARASDEIAAIVSAVKSQKGSLHQLIYPEEGTRFVEDLAAASRDMKEIMATIKKGEGTVGGLIEDPSVYEDLKSVLGNLKRNELLKALIRFSISKGDEQPAPAK